MWNDLGLLCLSGVDVEQVLLIPDCLPTLAFEATFGGCLLFQQVELVEALPAVAVGGKTLHGALGLYRRTVASSLGCAEPLSGLEPGAGRRR